MCAKTSNIQQLAQTIVKMRKRLLKMNCSGKNTAKCLRIIQELSIQMEAYGKKWNDEGWRSFVRRNLGSFEFLIPENPAGNSLKQKLHEQI